MSILDQTIVALDNMNEEEIFNFLDRSSNSFKTVKIGLEMFCKNGPDFVKKIHNRYGVDLFLDLKLHDIPNTVSKAIKSLEGLPIKFLTIHLAGGRNMLKAAYEQAITSLPNTKLLGVSYLTSLSVNDFQEMFGFDEEKIKMSFNNLFALAIQTNIQGVVLSPMELDIVKAKEKELGKKLIKVTPGIRFADEIGTGKVQDQSRINTPEKTTESGANFLVIGRSLTQAKDLNQRIQELS